MILERGNMWDVFGYTDLFLFTSNPIVNKQGLAVMGRGIALETAKRYPQIRKDFANHINSVWIPDCGYLGTYDSQAIGYFMVKKHWAANADLAIIDSSITDLLMLIEENNERGWKKRYDLNFPGIGNGKLSREEVLPHIEVLPDNVHVWEYDV